MKKIAIQGMLYDEKSSFLTGAAGAPPLIRASYHSGSSNYFAENGVNSHDSEWVEDKGDFTIQDYFDIERISAEHLLAGYRLLTLGGDHSISYPVLKAYSRFYSDIHILHIDAHPDLYHEFEHDPYSHASPFARIMEANHASRLVQVGIRALNPHQAEQAHKFGVEQQQMKDFDPAIVKTLNKPIYLSLDMDGIDPAYAPGVSHHEAGGLSTRQVINLIQSVEVPIIGADIVEFNPERDVGGITASLAGKLLKEILGAMIGNQLQKH